MKNTSIADFLRFDIAPGFALYVLPTGKFKTLTFRLYVHQPLGSEATKVALLPQVLSRGCRRTPTLRAIVVFLESLFGASMQVDVTKIGERHLIILGLDVINDRYAPKKIGVVDRSVNFLRYLLRDPVREKKTFKREYVEQEKLNLRRSIEALIDDRIAYASERCIQNMCSGEPYAIYEYGRVTEIDPITPEILEELHGRLMKTAPMDLFVVGHLDPEKLARKVARAFRFNGRRPVSIPPAQVDVPGKVAKEIIERKDVEQGNLVMGCRTRTTWASSDVAAMIFANAVLGGFPHAKLFTHVREREGLAYYAGSSLELSKGLLFIQAGIDFAKFERAVQVIRDQIDHVKAGRISDDEIRKTRSSLVDRIRSREDSPSGMIGSFAEQMIHAVRIPSGELIARYQSLSREEIAQAASKIEVDTLYFLTRP